MESIEKESTTGRPVSQIFSWFMKIENLWNVVCFFAIVFQLILVRGWDARIIWLYVLPILVAFIFSFAAATLSGRWLAKSFLFCVSLGLTISWFPSICPDLGGVDESLSPEQDATLAWYSIVYILYFTLLVPVHYLACGIYKHSRNEVFQVSKPICWFGIIATIPLGTILVLVMAQSSGLFPIFSID